MAILKAKANQDAAVSRVSEGDEVFIRATRDGALFTADWKQALITEGRGFMINLGAFSTGLDGGGSGAPILTDYPSALVGVPAGTTILPMRIEVSLAIPTGATAADEVDVLIAIDQDAVQASDSGTSTPETIYNINTLHSRSSNCYANAIYTTAMTTPVNDIELAHFQKIFDKGSSAGGIWTSVDFLYEPKTMPVINGPAMLTLYFGGTVTTEGFASIQWLELPSSVI